MKIKLYIMCVFLSLFLFLPSLFGLSVKAASVTFPSFPSPVEGQSSTHYVITYSQEDNTYYLHMPLNINDVYVYRSSKWNEIYYNGHVNYYKWQEGNSTWEFIRHYDGVIDTIFEDEQILYSSFNLKFENGDIFFQKAPIKANLSHQMGGVKMGAMMETVVYLIPLLMLLLVSLIAFRKAWAWLLKVLRTV